MGPRIEPRNNVADKPCQAYENGWRDLRAPCCHHPESSNEFGWPNGPGRVFMSSSVHQIYLVLSTLPYYGYRYVSHIIIQNTRIIGIAADHIYLIIPSVP